MTEGYKCDRCGKFTAKSYDIVSGKFYLQEEHRDELVTENGEHPDRLNVCKNCSKAVEQFIEGGVE